MRTEREKIAHLLRRFGLGASEAELDFYGQDGLNGAIDKLLNYEQIEQRLEVRPEMFLDDRRRVPSFPDVQTDWGIRMLTTRRPLEEKMALFWHHHFATAREKVDVSMVMHRQIDLFREKGLGRFLELLVAVSKDPAMIYWLDNQFNVKGKPNENFAREIMELFTLGIGHYTEKDIQEAARCFTGWGYTAGRRRDNAAKPRIDAEFVFRPEDHDDGVKTILGNTGRFTGEDVCGILCGRAETPRFLVKKIWEWFCCMNPSDAIVEKFARIFRESGLHIKTLLKAIMESEEFYSDVCFRRGYKNPAEVCVVAMRQLGLGATIEPDGDGRIPVANRLISRGALTSMKNMGMELLNPPDVAGWQIGPNWISSATMVERIKFGESLFTRLRYPAANLIAGQTPVEAVESLASVFDVQLPADKLKTISQGAEAATKGGPVTAANANAVAAAIAKLLFATPEFQFC